MYPHSRAPKKNTSHGNEVLQQDTTHLVQRSCCQRRSPCRDPTSNRTTQRPPDHRKETQTAVVWSCQQTTGPHEYLLTIVKRRKLQSYSHVSHLAKTILQGTVKGGRRQGRQRKRWEDKIREWTGLEFAKSQRAVENREKWRKLVVK